MQANSVQFDAPICHSKLTNVEYYRMSKVADVTILLKYIMYNWYHLW